MLVLSPSAVDDGSLELVTVTFTTEVAPMWAAVLTMVLAVGTIGILAAAAHLMSNERRARSERVWTGIGALITASATVAGCIALTAVPQEDSVSSRSKVVAAGHVDTKHRLYSAGGVLRELQLRLDTDPSWLLIVRDKADLAALDADSTDEVALECQPPAGGAKLLCGLAEIKLDGSFFGLTRTGGKTSTTELGAAP